MDTAPSTSSGQREKRYTALIASQMMIDLLSQEEFDDDNTVDPIPHCDDDEWRDDQNLDLLMDEDEGESSARSKSTSKRKATIDNESSVSEAPAKQTKQTGKGKGKGKRTVTVDDQPSPNNVEDLGLNEEAPSQQSLAPKQKLTVDWDWRPATVDESVGSSRFRNISSGIIHEVAADAKPIDFLRKLLTRKILDDLISNINDYAAVKIQKNTPLTKGSRLRDWPEGGIDHLYMTKFLAVIINIGMNHKPAIPDNWSCEVSKKQPWYATMFSRNKFQILFHTMLHAAEPGAEGKSKMEPFVNDLLTSFRKQFYPFENLSVDEMVIGWKGRFGSRQYNPSKPEKYHIKTFGLCDSITGYVCNLLIYFGQNTSYNPEMDNEGSHAVKVFDKLLEHLNGKHHIFSDRFYTSWPLLDYLQERGFNFTGTVNTQRRGFQQFSTNTLALREAKWFVDDNKGRMVAQWRDKKANKSVVVVTTKGDATQVVVKEGLETVKKPTVIDD